MEFVKLPTDYLLYASKKYNGQDILDYNKKIEKESGDKCHIENSSWFGTFNVAKSYKTKTTKIYKWSIIKDIDLIEFIYSRLNYLDLSINKNIYKDIKTELTIPIYSYSICNKKIHALIGMKNDREIKYRNSSYDLQQHFYDFVKAVSDFDLR